MVSMDETNNNRDSVPITVDLIKRVSDDMDEAIKNRPKNIFTKHEMLVQLQEKSLECARLDLPLNKSRNG